MSQSWQTIVIVILGLGVVALAGVSLVLWRRVGALATRVDRATRAEPVSVPVVAPAIPPVTSPAHPPTPNAIPAPRVAVVNRPRPVAAPDPRPAEPVGPTLIAVPDLRTTPAAATREPGPLDGRFGEVGALANAGATAAEIADQTGYPVGQVELILGLLRHRAAVVAGAGSDG